MKNYYFTITGTGYRFGQDVFEKKMLVKLVKEPATTPSEKNA